MPPIASSATDKAEIEETFYTTTDDAEIKEAFYAFFGDEIDDARQELQLMWCAGLLRTQSY
jgi:hypothetical protein